jgi:anaerobic selenocysteine-containing dehydrogenase
VQGNRTVGITEKPTAAFIERLKDVFGFDAPAKHGHDAVQATQAMIDGHAKALICLGGNFAVAMPDHENGFPAMHTLDLSVHVGTKLNRTHLLVGKETYILPCLGRTELDMQQTGRQSITVEDSMSMVHASSGKLKPASPLIRSEPAIVAGMARATLKQTKVNWMELVADYDLIRELIEQTIPGFDNYNDRIRVPGGFRMPLPPIQRIWPTATGKAMFSVFDGVDENAKGEGDNVLRLITLRSHDQYNTTIYALDDRYRGVFGRRDILFMNEGDMEIWVWSTATAWISKPRWQEVFSASRILPWWPTASRRVPLAPTTRKLTCWCRLTTSIKTVVPHPISPCLFA